MFRVPDLTSDARWQAKGVLMAQRKVTADAAFDLLRAASNHRNVKLRRLALDVVETGLLEWPPDPA